MLPKIKGHEKTAHGAVILSKKNLNDGWFIVLCDVSETSIHPFVTWLMSPEGNTSSGHYFFDLLDAVDDFNGRKG